MATFVSLQCLEFSRGQHNLVDEVLHAADLPLVLPHLQGSGLDPGSRDRDRLQQGEAYGAHQGNCQIDIDKIGIFYRFLFLYLTKGLRKGQ